MSIHSQKSLPFSARWMRDGLTVSQVPAFCMSIQAEMTKSRSLIESAKSQGIRLTYSHVFVRATALALRENPDLHVMMSGNRIYQPSQVDIGLSISGDTAVAPVMVIENADGKLVHEIAREITERVPAVREADKALMNMLDRWGFLVPLGFLRRALLRTLLKGVNFRRKGSGTFQVSVLPGIDTGTTPVFSSSAILIAGSIRDQAVVIDGEVAVQLMVTLTCCADHRVWDGRAGLRFLQSVRSVLESGRLAEELQTSQQQVDSLAF